MRDNIVKRVADALKQRWEFGELKPNFSRAQIAKELKCNVWNVSDATKLLKKEGFNLRKEFRAPKKKKEKLNPTLKDAIELTGSIISVIKAVGTPEQVAEFFKRYEK